MYIYVTIWRLHNFIVTTYCMKALYIDFSTTAKYLVCNQFLFQKMDLYLFSNYTNRTHIIHIVFSNWFNENVSVDFTEKFMSTRINKYSIPIIEDKSY